MVNRRTPRVWTHVPRLAAMDRLLRLSAFQDHKVAFQEIRGIETRMRVETAIHSRRNFDKHHDGFVAATGTSNRSRISASLDPT
jgi:hypothetical protein